MPSLSPTNRNSLDCSSITYILHRLSSVQTLSLQAFLCSKHTRPPARLDFCLFTRPKAQFATQAAHSLKHLRTGEVL